MSKKNDSSKNKIGFTMKNDEKSLNKNLYNNFMIAKAPT